MLMLLWKHRYPTYLLPNFAHTLLLWPYVSCRRTLDIGPWLVAEYKCWIQKKLMARGAWVHKLYALYYSDLKIDRHSFPGDVSLRFWFFKPRHWPAHWHFCCAQECMIGFVYAGESGAEKFIRKVDSKKRFRYRWERCPKKKKSALSKDKIDKSMISSPQIRFLQAHCPHGVRGWYGVVIRECRFILGSLT